MKRGFITLLLSVVAVAASAQVLNVATYNIRLNSKKDYKTQNGWTERRDELCAMINHEAFDVFGAQEVKKEQLDDMCKRLPDYKYIGVARDDGKDKGEFCPVFYNKRVLKKLDGGTFWLSETPDVPSRGWDAKCRRVCSWGHFQHKASKKCFYFLNIHLDHKGKQAKVKGLQQVLDFAKAHCGNEQVFIVGDFNIQETGEGYHLINTCGAYDDCYNVSKYRFAPTGTSNGFRIGTWRSYRIDHIFVSKGSEVQRYGILAYHRYRNKYAERGEESPEVVKPENRDIRTLSDHYPVQAFVKLK